MPWHRKGSWPFPSPPSAGWGEESKAAAERVERDVLGEWLGPQIQEISIGGLGGGCSQYLFFHLVSGEEGLGGGIYLGRRYGLSNPASMVRLLVSPNREKGRSFRVAVGGVGFERS